ncbi:MAG: hypothetical protein DMD73_04910 [Gemmatimonadetes bacterium]|nr:MAG: hypothetical protein DMD73_04910 [Gemmatimonadota bacterium]
MSDAVPPRCPHWYEFGPFRLVPEERLLLCNTQVIHLTPKVFDTLVALVQNSGRLLPKRELLELIWPDSVVEENNLTQAISAIRKALGGSDHSPEYIETVPKQGYRFVAAVKNHERDRLGGRRGGRWMSAGAAVFALTVLAAAGVGLRQGWWRPPRREVALGAALERRHTASVDAYRNYLDGLGAFNQRTDPSLRAAIFYFERAIEQDSSYASAYAALADCYVLLGLYNASSQEVLPKAHVAALRAVSIPSILWHTTGTASRTGCRWDATIGP